jgi:hypothetical protein
MPNLNSQISQTRPAHLQVRGPAALVAAVPYLLPEAGSASVVVATVTQQSVLRALIGAPLPAFPGGGSPEVCRSWADDVGRRMTTLMAELPLAQGESHAVVVRLPEQFSAAPAWFGERILATSPAWTDNVLDVLAAFDGRWRSLICRDESCCPPQGAVVLDHPDAVAVAAELIGLAGAVAVQDRGDAWSDGSWDDDPAPEPDVATALAALPVASDPVARRVLLEQVWPLLGAGAGPTRSWEVALLGHAAMRPGVRDALLVRMAARHVRAGAPWSRWSEVLRGVAEALPPGRSAGAWCLAGACAWADDDPQEALECLTAALEAEPQHRMAKLVQRLVVEQQHAGPWLSRMARVREDVCLAYDRRTP